MQKLGLSKSLIRECLNKLLRSQVLLHIISNVPSRPKASLLHLLSHVLRWQRLYLCTRSEDLAAIKTRFERKYCSSLVNLYPKHAHVIMVHAYGLRYQQWLQN